MRTATSQPRVITPHITLENSLKSIGKYPNQRFPPYWQMNATTQYSLGWMPKLFLWRNYLVITWSSVHVVIINIQNGTMRSLDAMTWWTWKYIDTDCWGWGWGATQHCIWSLDTSLVSTSLVSRDQRTISRGLGLHKWEGVSLSNNPLDELDWMVDLTQSERSTWQK